MRGRSSRAFERPSEPCYRLVGSIDNIACPLRELASLLDEAHAHLEVLAEKKQRRAGGLSDVPHDAIVDRGQLVGLWDYAPALGTIVWKAFGEPTTAVEQEIALVETYIREQLGDTRAFNLDRTPGRTLACGETSVTLTATAYALPSPPSPPSSTGRAPSPPPPRPTRRGARYTRQWQTFAAWCSTKGCPSIPAAPAALAADLAARVDGSATDRARKAAGLEFALAAIATAPRTKRPASPPPATRLRSAPSAPASAARSAPPTKPTRKPAAASSRSPSDPRPRSAPSARFAPGSTLPALSRALSSGASSGTALPRSPL